MSPSSQLIKKVLDFWFTESLKLSLTATPLSPIPATAFKLWFGSDASTDTLITDTFSETLRDLASDPNQRAQLASSPEGALSLLIIFDQFSRNIFRNRAEAFDYDHLALEAAKLIRMNAWDLQMNPIHRGFAYLPFEHSESLNDQLTSVELYKQLHASVIESPELNPLYGQFTQQFLNYAILHHDIIAKFGRYPHRNFILGRTSSAEEIEYLESGAQTFGVTKIK